MLVTACTAAASAQQLPVPAGVPAQLPGTSAAAVAAPATIAWTVDVPAAPIVSPIITADRVVLAHLPGIVAAFDRADGRVVWRAELSPEQPLATDGTLVFIAAGEQIHALRLADGSAAWRAPTGTLTAPLTVKDGWLVAPIDGRLTARRVADGSAVWTIDAPPQREAAAIAGDVLFASVAGGKLVARDLANGAIKWERQLGGESGEPFVLGDDVFLGAADKGFYCVDAVTGEIEWRMRVGAAIRGRASTDGVRVFFAALDNLVRAVDRSDGAMRWHKGMPFRPMAGPVVAGGSVFVAGPGTELRVLLAATGNPAGIVTFPGRQALPPGAFETATGAVFAAVTGNLEESWSLSLTVPMPAGTAR